MHYPPCDKQRPVTCTTPLGPRNHCDMHYPLGPRSPSDMHHPHATEALVTCTTPLVTTQPVTCTIPLVTRSAHKHHDTLGPCKLTCRNVEGTCRRNHRPQADTSKRGKQLSFTALAVQGNCRRSHRRDSVTPHQSKLRWRHIHTPRTLRRRHTVTPPLAARIMPATASRPSPGGSTAVTP